MSRGPQASVEVQQVVTRLTLEGFGPAAIYKRLEALGWPGMERGLTERTIQRMVQRAAVQDESGPWSLAEADPAEAPLVIDAVARMFEISAGLSWLTKDQAAEIARIRRAAPGIPAYWATELAFMYLLSKSKGFDARHLDFVLGFRPWEDEEKADWLMSALAGRRPSPENTSMLVSSLWNFVGSFSEFQRAFQEAVDREL